MKLTTVLAPVAEPLADVHRVILDELKSQVPLIEQIGAHIVAAGGKRLRPAMTLLAAGACGGINANATKLAAVIEFIHTATLLHDDVVDNTNLRRGRLTANAQWSNAAAVLSGDFLYSRAFQMMVAVGSMPVMRVMADTTNAIAEGEVLQLQNARNPETPEASYFQVIRLKTAVLFEAAAKIGAIGAGATPAQVGAMGAYALELGTAYQLADDVLDYTASPEESGKAIGNDLAEGKPTLPLIYALPRCDAADAAQIRKILKTGELGSQAESLALVQKVIESSGALPYTTQLAERHAAAACNALSSLPDSDYRRALQDLAAFAITRKH